VNIGTSLDTARQSAESYIEDHLPDGKLKNLAKAMVENTCNFYSKLHSFFETEMRELTQIKLPHDEVLKLLSEYVIILCDRLFRLRQNVREFTVNMPLVDYMSRVIWVSLLVNQEMANMLKGQLKYEAVLSTAYMRFLTVRTGKNSGAGLGTRITTVEGWKATSG